MLSKVEVLKKLFAIRDALECDSQENIVEIEKIDEVIRFIVETESPKETFIPVPYTVPYYPPYGYEPYKIWCGTNTGGPKVQGSGVIHT